MLTPLAVFATSLAEVFVNRGMTEEECKKLLLAPDDLPVDVTLKEIRRRLRDKIILRLLYETFVRVGELSKIEVRDVDLKECSIFVRFPKRKAVFSGRGDKRVHVDTVKETRHVSFSKTTKNLLIQYLEGRRSGNLFGLTPRQIERIVDRWAKKAGIQQVRMTSGGRRYGLVCPKALREAGERHCDISGADRDATAELAGHTVQTKEKYYKKSDFEELRKVVRKHHPSFNEDE